MEYDREVLEYYDQPPTIKLNYESASGRQVGVKHTPDFFEIGQRSAAWSEWKTTQELEQLAIKNAQPLPENRNWSMAMSSWGILCK